MKALLLTTSVVVAFLLGPAQAEEKVLKMKLVTKFMEKAGDGARVFGVTFTPDGTIGTKDFFIKDSEKKGEFFGLSTYSFNDGTITASFVGQELDKERNKGTYVILTGTGIYEGAKGSGGFEGLGSGAHPLKVGVYDVTLNVTVPPRSN